MRINRRLTQKRVESFKTSLNVNGKKNVFVQLSEAALTPDERIGFEKFISIALCLRKYYRLSKFRESKN